MEHWTGLARQLPPMGVSKAFRSEAVCLKRLTKARWPGGVSCPKCGNRRTPPLPGRDVFLCRNCRHQFSATSGTAFHLTRIPLRKWFICGELIIVGQANDNRPRTVSAQHISDALNLAYPSARGLKRKVIQELQRPNGGLLGACLTMPTVSSLT